MKTISNKSIIIFDGYCNLCNSSVQFIIKRDPLQKFIFSSLQSDASQQILLQLNYKNNQINTIILIEDNTIYEKSTAVLLIAKHLSPYWHYSQYLLYIQKKYRDWIYDFIAKNRYKWFGKRESCTVELENLNNRFL